METRFVQAGAVRLQYFEHGEGPELLLLVHGYSASARIWKLTQEALDSKRFRTIALSNRGAGDSDHTSAEEDYSCENFAKDLIAAVKALGLENFTLVGHSMGGGTATYFALDHPERIKGFVLLDPAPLGGRELTEGWEEAVRERFLKRAGDPDLDRQKQSTPQDFREALQADVDRNPLERYVGGRRSMAGLRLRQRLGELKMPVLVVGGDQDKTVGIDNILAEFLALSSETRSLHIFHGIGHSPNYETPAQLASVLDHFVTQTIPASAAKPVSV